MDGPSSKHCCNIAGTGVTHPLGFDQSEPSIAAVVGSMDAKCSRYSAEVQLQGHRVEIIQVLTSVLPLSVKTSTETTF